jgi:hypothetical protein
MEPICVQGRTLRSQELAWLRSLILERPEWGRYRLSQHIAREWGWCNGAGVLKDMAARTLLLKLERRGLLKLPPRRREGGSKPALKPTHAQRDLLAHPAIEAPLAELLPLDCVLVQEPTQREWLRGLLAAHHYLGYQRAVGENLQYLVWDRQRRPVACLVFGAAAWKCAPRDQFIGWPPAVRQRGLPLVANNMRFLILPWVRVPHLASHVLGRVSQRLSADWQAKYGHPIWLLETFVQRDRFTGACYRAANWQPVGQTQGRSRNDARRQLQAGIKDIYVYGLSRNFRRHLLAGV